MYVYRALATETVRALRAGAPDANGQTPERVTAEGTGNPCRHCLGFVPEGAAMLILAHRPFDRLNPYAETGPIFLCAGDCDRGESTEPPAILTSAPDYLLRGYDTSDRIVYGTGGVVPKDAVTARLDTLFDVPGVAYVHVRSARNNCFQLRIDRV